MNMLMKIVWGQSALKIKRLVDINAAVHGPLYTEIIIAKSLAT